MIQYLKVDNDEQQTKYLSFDEKKMKYKL